MAPATLHVRQVYWFFPVLFDSCEIPEANTFHVLHRAHDIVTAHSLYGHQWEIWTTGAGWGTQSYQHRPIYCKSLDQTWNSWTIKKRISRCAVLKRIYLSCESSFKAFIGINAVGSGDLGILKFPQKKCRACLFLSPAQRSLESIQALKCFNVWNNCHLYTGE